MYSPTTPAHSKPDCAGNPATVPRRQPGKPGAAPFCRSIRRMISATVAVLFHAPSAWAQSLDAYIPASGVVVGNVMEVVASPEVEELTRRVQIAMAENRNWFIAYVAQARPGPLPYHPNLGLTEAEYDRYLYLMNSGALSLRPAAPVEVTFTREQNGAVTVVLDLNGVSLPLVSISADQQYADTSFGRLNRTDDVNQVDPNSPTGRWSGPRWENEQTTIAAFWTAQFSIGRREDFNDIIIYYTATSLRPAEQRISLVVVYNLDPA